MWFAIRMTDTETGWAWKYVSLSRDRKPETPDIDTMLTRRSDSEYAVEGPSYEENGARVTEHHVPQAVGHHPRGPDEKRAPAGPRRAPSPSGSRWLGV